MATKHPKINEKFATALPPLSDLELTGLEAEIVAAGRVRDPVTTWQGFVADGHNRLEIAKRNSLPYPTIELPTDKYKTEDAVVAWIIDQQLARRNLSAQSYSYYRGKRLNSTPSSQGKPSEQSKSAVAKKLADEAGVSVGTIYVDAATSQAVDGLGKSLKQKYLAGDVKLTTQELKKLSSLKPAQQRKIELSVLTGAVEPAGKKSAWSVALGLTAPPTAKPKKPPEGKPKAFDPKEVAEAFGHLTKMIDAMHKATPDKAARNAIQDHLNAAYKRFKEWAA